MLKNRWSKSLAREGEHSASSLPPGEVWGMHPQSFDLALHLKAGSRWEGGKEGIRWEEPSLMTWVLLWRARSSDISSRAAQETNLPGARHKWTGGDLGGRVVEGFAEAWGYHEITPEKIQM